MKRVIAYIDGFNLYHSLCKLENAAKWLNLKDLSSRYANKPDQNLTAVKYFSAYATWLPGPYSRHRRYVAALKSRGIEFIEGKFKNKDRLCKKCGAKWIAHEEKETDVNIGIHLVSDAFINSYDHALVFSADSDLAPAIKMVRNRFPDKFIYVVTPPKATPSGELLRAAGGFSFSREVKVSHIMNSLLPEKIYDSSGQLIVERPTEYQV